MPELVQQDKPNALGSESLAVFERESFSHLSTLGNAIYHLARPYIVASGSNNCGHTTSWSIDFDRVHKKSPALQEGFTTFNPPKMIVSLPDNGKRIHLVFERATPSEAFQLSLVNTPNENLYVQPPNANCTPLNEDFYLRYRAQITTIVAELAFGLLPNC